MEFDIQPKDDTSAIDFRPLRLIVVLTFAVVLIWPIFSERTGRSLPTCLWLSTFHSPCPGCGMTRSIARIWHGDVVGSFRLHPLGIPLFVGSAVGVVYETVRMRERRKSKFESAVFSHKIAVALFVVYISVWLLRMLMHRLGLVILVF